MVVEGHVVRAPEGLMLLYSTHRGRSASKARGGEVEELCALLQQSS